MPRTYLITSSSGIGAATALEIARSSVTDGGAQIFLTSRTAGTCDPLILKLRSLDTAAECLTGDLTDPAYARVLVAACVARFGRLDGLFNVAGISGRRFGDGAVHQCTEEGWAITLQTNLSTQYRMCREAVRVMREQPLVNGQRGVILNMSSILAFHPEPVHFDTVAYAACKGGIIAMSKSMAASYLKEKIRVNSIAPALVRTSMSAHAAEDPIILDFVRAKQSLVEDVIAVEDVGASCRFLLTEESHSITGQCLEADAGWSLS